MAEPLKELERHIESLRTGVRHAAMSGDRARARELRAELRRAERAWDEALALTAPEQEPDQVRPSDPLSSTRDRVHQTLTLLGAPSAPKLIVAVHNTFFAGELAGAQLTSLRRDEQRSFRSSPHARPYYLCCALSADRLVPARDLLAVSAWPMARRTIGPLSARVDFLTAAIRLSEQIDKMAEPAVPGLSLLWQFATNIPGAARSFDFIEPAIVAEAARAELALHQEADQAHREAAASRARTQLDEIHQLFGSALKPARRAETKD